MARKHYYLCLKSLSGKEEPTLGETSRPNKLGKKEIIEEMVVLSS